jgi:hypothetical protein
MWARVIGAGSDSCRPNSSTLPVETRPIDKESKR